MVDFAVARRMMVDGQVRPNDVTDLRIIAAMLEVPREHFLPPELADFAYLDLDAPVLEGQGRDGGRHWLKPMVLAKLLQAAEIEQTDAVLDVGCTTGYSSAVLAQLAGSVTALEENVALTQRAEAALAVLGLSNVSVVPGPVVAGWPSRAPYDVIILQGASQMEPRELFTQLAEGGRLVCVRGGPVLGKAVVYRRAGNDVSGWPAFDATAQILPGFSKAPTFVF